ncbi:Imm1 family immunity protein [Amycolatopsis sp. QT-25]|nr:Imm1 family immunity protein [Amycolatopsis sp. QT-25]WET76854.1 Imm1 family immunity protein [Amycolatopsis sp. QT-25]
MAWFDREAPGPTQVETAADLDAVLDVLAATRRPNLVELTVAGDPGRAVLNVGLDGARGRGVLYCSGATDPSVDAYYSRGAKSDDAETIYYYMGSDTEFPEDAELPISEVRKAAHQFLSTGGERPDGIDWQADDF